ncbi:MAG: hypothetical protein C0469_14260 [Cyanobacteria bacterium DS2.3.42]|nr:hypothetical protein [Cyanobacteria bacterium DS2.3.42]
MLEVVDRKKAIHVDAKHLPSKTVALSSLGYFVASLAIVVGSIFALDRWIIPALENSGQLESYLWTDENHRLNHFTYLKNDARQSDPVWRSQYMPVSPEHPGKKRIMVIGDSFVWGDGADNVNTLWWRQLEMELEKRGYSDVEVIAAGLNGASTDDEFGWLHTLLPKYKPDLVVFGYVTNDPAQKDANGQAYVNMLPKELPDNDPVFAKLKTILPNLTGQLLQIRNLALQANVSKKSSALEYANWELALLEGENFKSYRKTLERLSSFLKAAQVPAFVMALPAGFQNKTQENTVQSRDFFKNVRDYNSIRYAKVKPVFAAVGLPFIDSSDDFAKAAAADPLLKKSSSALRLGINPGNGHPGPFSTHFYAVSAIDTIEKLFPAALGEKSGQSRVQKIAINDCMPPYMNVQVDSNKPDTFNFTYPPDVTEHTLYMPLRRKHVQLSLKRPVSVRQIEIQGTDLAAAQIYLSFYDDGLDYAPGLFETLPLKKGKALSWEVSTVRKVSAIKLRAGFNGANQALQLRFIEK